MCFSLISDAVNIKMMTASITGWLMNVEQLVKWELAGETKVLRENMPQSNFIPQKSTIT
jgi:hypothetical protein